MRRYGTEPVSHICGLISRLFIYSFIHSFIHSFHSFVRLFISFVRSFISFVRSFIQPTRSLKRTPLIIIKSIHITTINAAGTT